MSAPTEPQAEDRPSTLYRHTKRSGWGRAILAWSRDGRRAYQFEDGELRVFASAFQALMKPIDEPLDVARPVVDRLVIQLTANDAEAARARTKTVSTPREQPLTLEEQVAFFRTQYEKGFLDLTWRHDVRGADVKRRLKRHRDPGIAEAQELLSAERIDSLMASQQFGAVHADVVKVLEGTDLVTPDQVKPITRLDGRHHQALSQGVRDLLHGDGAIGLRLGRFLERLTEMTGSVPSWQLATTLPALFAPDQHVCVRVTAVREQARSMAPGLDVKHAPSAAAYERLVVMAKALAERLRGEGLEPRDLMDIHDFMRVTLAPKARKAAATTPRGGRQADKATAAA